MTFRIYCDGGSRGNPGPAASAFIVKDDKDEIVYQQGFYLGETTNNQAEYVAVEKALEYLTSPLTPLLNSGEGNERGEVVNFFLDSELVVKQLTGVYKIKDQKILEKVKRIKHLLESLHISVSFHHVLRNKNFSADQLVNDTLDLVRK